jgi:outer membrane murein-binding lipoprotein Lpp
MNTTKTIIIFLILIAVQSTALATGDCRIQQKSVSTAQKQLNKAIKDIDRNIRRYDRAVYAYQRTRSRAALRIDRLEAKRARVLIDVGIWAARCTFFDERACRKWDRMLRRVVKMKQQISIQESRMDRTLALSARKIAQAEGRIIDAEHKAEYYHFNLVDAEIELTRCLAG